MNGWDRVIGHDWAVRLLAAAVEYQRVGHAYLITGPAQIGKTTLARTFAQTLNCEAVELAARPCGRCRPCQLIAVDRHPDIRLLLPEISGRGKLTIKIDQIRELQQRLSLTAAEARYKVAILKQFDAAYPSAANAFLKTLEEPPNQVVLILTAADAETLLPTISSRCRTVALRPLPAALIARSLQERWQVSAEKAQLLAHLSDGRLGWAVQSAADERALDERTRQLGYLDDILGQKQYERFDTADKLSRKPEELPDVLRTWLSWWRDLVLLAVGLEAADVLQPVVTNVDRQPQFERLAQSWPAPAIVESLQQTGRALWQLERNANTRLVLENLFLVYPSS